MFACWLELQLSTIGERVYLWNLLCWDPLSKGESLIQMAPSDWKAKVCSCGSQRDTVSFGTHLPFVVGGICNARRYATDLWHRLDQSLRGSHFIHWGKASIEFLLGAKKRLDLSWLLRFGADSDPNEQRKARLQRCATIQTKVEIQTSSRCGIHSP